MCRLDGRRYAPKSTTRYRRLDMQPEDTNIGCLLGRLSMIGVGSPDTFIYPRRNRLEMPGTAPELLRSGETTPITLSVKE